jgi:hypothetical protein
MAADSSHLIARFPEFFFTSLCNLEQGWQPATIEERRELYSFQEMLDVKDAEQMIAAKLPHCLSS